MATAAAIAPADLRISRTVQPRPTNADSHAAMTNFAEQQQSQTATHQANFSPGGVCVFY